MLNLFRIIRLYRNFKKRIPKIDPFFLHKFAGVDIKCVDRREYIIDLSKNKRVMHFGFLDSPLLEEKIADNLLLHQEIKKNAKFLLGIDIDEDSLSRYRNITGDNNNLIYNLQHGYEQPLLIDNYDLILFPEVLEHIPNPGLTLENLRKLCVLNNNATLCITVPNAFSIEGIITAMNNIEIVHPDHYYYFSPVTLTKLLTDHGYHNIKLTFYGFEATPGLTKNGIIALCSP